jgi:hypothetical protein
MMNPWIILGFVLAIAASGSAGYYKGDENGQLKVQALWDAERIKQQEQHARALQEAAEKQQGLQLGADMLRQEKDREYKKVVDTNRVLFNSLRERPSRPTADSGALPDTSGARPSGCTPRELYREDSEVVVELARQADEIRVALKQCYAQYETLRK